MDNEFITPETPETPTPEVPKGQAIKSLVFGILSIVLGFYPIFSIIGIVFSGIAVKNANEFLNTYTDTPVRGMANAGRITGKIGLPVSIVCTVLYVLAFAIGILVGMMAALG